MKIPPEYLEENNWANEQYEMDVGEEKEEEEYDDSTTESFYAAYLRVQEEKLQKQQFEVHRLVEKVKEESETDRTLIANLSLNTLKRTEPEELEFYEASVLDAESKSDADDWEVPEVKFAFLLAEAISLEEHRNILKEQLRYKVYEIFRLFSYVRFYSASLAQISQANSSQPRLKLS